MAPNLRLNSVLHNDKGDAYKVMSFLGQGGFGRTYLGKRLNKHGQPWGDVCIKVCISRRDWHGEAFFGDLLRDQQRVVRLRDAFVSATGQGGNQRRRHILVFDYMSEGTVWDWHDRGDGQWTEHKVRTEIKAILKVLALLHNAGVTHRDLKPDNVFLRDGRLVLGDFGIAKMALDPSQSFASAFAPAFAPNEVLQRLRWGQADDVFQVGLLAGTLLSGDLWTANLVSAKSIAALPISDAFKSWIWHATGPSSKRYWDATDALDALDALRRIKLDPGKRPRSLNGAALVFTGKVPGLTRAQAAERARDAGARVQTHLTDTTTILIVGRLNGGGVGANEDLKLFETRERRRLGQDLLILSSNQFLKLVR